MSKLTWRAAILLSMLAALVACAPDRAVVRPEQATITGFATLTPERRLGQTFSADFDGLQGIQVYLAPDGNAGGSLVLQLRTTPPEASGASATNLRTAELPLSQVIESGYYTFAFAPLPDSALQNYFFALKLNGQGSVQVGSAPGNRYLEGSLYDGGVPQDSQLAFNLSYQPLRMAAGLLQEGLRWLAYLLLVAVLFALPGWALLSLLAPGWGTLHWAGRFGLASGLSLAVYPVMMLWTGLAGLRLGSAYAWLPALAGALALGGQYARRTMRRSSGQSSKERLPFASKVRRMANGLRAIPRASDFWPNATLLGLLALLVFSRLWAIRTLDLPLWGDSYQHTLMAQLLTDHSGLFDSWQPYTDLATFTYHFGFHSLAAVFHWASGLPIPASVLWTGQLLNILAVIGLVPLALRLGRNAWAAPAIVLFAGLLFSMPMYYTNWGRYTQLAGQALLPAAIWLAWAYLDSRHGERAWLPLVWLAFGGLALMHYRVLVFAVLFFPAYWLFQLRSGTLGRTILRTLWAGSGAFLLFLPWLVHTFAGSLDQAFANHISAIPGQSSTAAQAVEIENSIGDLKRFLPVLAWLGTPLVFAWGLWRRERQAALLGLWWYLAFLATNPQMVGLPGAGIISNFALFIAAYIPAGLILAAGAGWVGEGLQLSQETMLATAPDGVRANASTATTPEEPVQQIEPEPGRVDSLSKAQVEGANPYGSRRKTTKSWPVGLALLMLALGAWGLLARGADLKPAEHAIAVRPDLRAASWIRANLPAEARLLVNAFFAYSGTAIVGSDGGWWLPLLTLRQTTLPPLTYLAEQGERPDFIEWTNQLQTVIEQNGVTSPQALQMLRQRGVTHVYLGQKHANPAGADPGLDPDTLLASPYFRPVYHQDRVWIFEILPQP